MVMRFRLSSVNFRKIFVKLAKAFTVQCSSNTMQQIVLTKFIGTKERFYRKKRVQSLQVFFCTPIWSPMYCFVHQYGRCDVMWKPSYSDSHAMFAHVMNELREEFEMRWTYFTPQDPLFLVWTLIILNLNIYYSFLTQYCFFKKFLWQLA